MTVLTPAPAASLVADGLSDARVLAAARSQVLDETDRLPHGLDPEVAVDQLVARVNSLLEPLRTASADAHEVCRLTDRLVMSPASAERSDAAGMFWPDAELARIAESTGSGGRKLASEIRAKSVAAWIDVGTWQPDVDGRLVVAGADPGAVLRLWSPAGGGVRSLAWCAWHDQVRAAVGAWKFPTLPQDYGPACVRSSFRRHREILPLDDRRVVVNEARVVGILRPPPVARLPSTVVGAAELKASSSLIAHRLFRWIPVRARQQVVRDRLDVARSTPVITITGGLEALALEVGVGTGKADELRRALDWFQALHAVDDDGTEYAGLILWSLERQRRGRPARLTVTPSQALLLGVGRGKLVPVPHRLPRFVGRRNEWAAQASLQLLVLDELRSRAIELVEGGGALLTAGRWAELADGAEVARRCLAELLDDAWVQDGNGEPAFLRRLPGDRWTLAPAYGAELDVLREGGAWDARARHAGRKSGRARAARRNRQ